MCTSDPMAAALKCGPCSIVRRATCESLRKEERCSDGKACVLHACYEHL